MQSNTQKLRHLNTILSETNNTQSLRNQVHFSETDSYEKTWLYLYPEENLSVNSELKTRFKNDISIKCKATITFLEGATPTLTYNNNGNANTKPTNGGSLTPIGTWNFP